MEKNIQPLIGRMALPFLVANWKMNCTPSESALLARDIRDGVDSSARVSIALAPSFTALHAVHEVLAGSSIALAAQTVSSEVKGAFTGDVSPRELAELGCTYVLVGHSERRHVFLETDQMMAKKVSGLLATSLNPILCIGETEAERDRGETLRVLERQLAIGLEPVATHDLTRLTIAYEPVWAIGTGRTPTSEDISKTHAFIRDWLVTRFGEPARARPILYGGSVTPDNTAALISTKGVGGLLIGGASLKAATFLKIVDLVEQIVH